MTAVGPFAWAVVVLYLAAAATTLSAGSRVLDATGRIPARKRRGEARPVWLAITAVLVLGAIDRRYGLLSGTVDALRAASQTGGWYADRRPLQASFIVATALVGGVALHAIRAAVGRAGRPVAIAAVTTAMLVAFLLIRATSLHGVDAVLRTQVLGFSLYTAPELAGLLIVMVTALTERRIVHRRVLPGAEPAV
ncbi:hypothetical protein GGR88_000438 [Sphingomonas jejuensis]|uniref:Lycopene cyclase domain-containing protein n=1 Tax=Sphingomonas jejuensis TaxID=904715 RepID=A0ABX0XJE1_9SPHN|nr:hypothetical protein [Sphingomonas jejuensis]NJC32964.1 hypothetical protein [Sphingomonas jejuensis]